MEEAANGAPPWSFVSNIDASAKWIWSYFSTAPFKPDYEPVLFRRTVYVGLDGGFSPTPLACP